MNYEKYEWFHTTANFYKINKMNTENNYTSTMFYAF